MAAKTELKVGPHKLAVGNLDKVLYPAGKFTKAHVINYYAQVSRFLLPHFKDRPVTLKRFPDGVFGDHFYEKDAPSFTPDWITTFPVPRREGGPDIDYILINDKPTLVWAASVAALELHPFLHRAPKLDTPTSIVFDLDPGEGADVLACAEVGCLLQELLQQFRLKCFPKVSGSKGIQVYVPLNAPVTYGVTQPFAKAIAELLARQHPDLIVAEMTRALRGGKVFIDWSQNADHKTTVGVYSLRAKRERPYISMPVSWDELKQAARKGDRNQLYFEPDEALARLKKVGDLFAPVLKLKQKLPGEILSRFSTEKPTRPKPPRSLATYRAKRNFARTGEPEPATPRRSAQGSRRRFVVQKHAASHLHYDFRLEMHDVLRSWAVPKGIPLKTGDTRTAFATEDHPIEYLDFEGNIPKGEYGGGTVMVWDIGTWEPVEGNYFKGKLLVYLAGKKLKGEWLLERHDDRKWLITRTGSDNKRISAKAEDVSALTGRAMENIAADTKKIWRSKRAPNPAPLPTQTDSTLNHLPKSEPEFVSPMMAMPTNDLPEGDEWLYELKLDGYRVVALKQNGSVRLLSRKKNNLTRDYPEVVEAVRSIHANTAVLDGEVVVLDNKGRPSFQMLQNRASLGKNRPLVYYAFDLLNLNGRSLLSLPLEQRKQHLASVITASPVLFSADLPGTPHEIIKQVEKLGLEGIIAKRRDAPYQPGKRTGSWQKLKLVPEQEFVIGGYKPGFGNFEQLVVGYYEGGKLIFAGRVRAGFTPAMRAGLWRRLKPLEIANCPFTNLPNAKKSHWGEGVTVEDMKKLRWLKPQLVAQISFNEWTRDGALRHSQFIALRDDKHPKEVVRET